jgi:hypothetical protein
MRCGSSFLERGVKCSRSIGLRSIEKSLLCRENRLEPACPLVLPEAGPVVRPACRSAVRHAGRDPVKRDRQSRPDEERQGKQSRQECDFLVAFVSLDELSAIHAHRDDQYGLPSHICKAGILCSMIPEVRE